MTSVLVPVMNSDVAVTFTDKWAAMLRDAGPPNWTNYYWYEVGTDLGAGKAAAARKLWVCISGSPPAKQRVQPVLNAIGQGTASVASGRA